MSLAWDTETRSFRWWEPGTPFLASWDSGEGGKVAALPPYARGAEQLPALDEFVLRLKAERHLIGANMKFDAHMARAAGLGDIYEDHGRQPEDVDDVLMMSRLWFGNRRGQHGLKELATDLIDPGAKDAESEMQEAYHALTGRTDMAHDDAFFVTWQAQPDLVEKYAALDAVYTRGLRDIIFPHIEGDAKLLSLYRLEQRVSRVLYHSERIGTRVDPDAVERLSRHYAERDEAARGALQRELGLVPEGEGSEEALREALVDAGVPLTERTEKTGELAINRKALQPFVDHPAVAALFEWRRVNKFRSTYIGPLEGRDIVHPTFNQAQAWTGRMSGQNPNMQNLPKRTEATPDDNLKVRSVFVPRPGYAFIVADFDSIEMRVLAYYLGDPGYRKLIASGDPHAITAAAAFGGAPEDYYKGTDGRWLRDISKHATYGIVYGGGGPVIRDTINRMVVEAGHPEYMVDLEQARGIRRKITDAIPGFKALTASPWRGKSYPRGRLYEQLLASQDGDYGYIRTLMGRKQWISLEKSYVALSGLIQGSAADVMKQAAVNVFEATKPFGAYPLLYVHDEMVVEVPIPEVEATLPVVVEAMEQAADIDPPLKVEAHWTTESYAHAH